MHRRAPDVHLYCRGQPLTALSQRGVRLLLMEVLHEGQIGPDLPWIAAPMGLRRHAARPTVVLQEALDKAQADAKDAG